MRTPLVPFDLHHEEQGHETLLIQAFAAILHSMINDTHGGKTERSAQNLRATKT